MRFSTLTTIILSLLFVPKMEAQKNIPDSIHSLNIEISIPTRANEKVYFGKYWKKQTFAQDSLILDRQGKGNMSINESIAPGQYFILIKSDFHIDLLIDKGQDNIRLYVDENNPEKNTVTGSKDTELLWDYINDYNTKELQREALIQQLQMPDLTPDNRASKEKQVQEFDRKRKKELTTLINQHKDTWFAIFLKGREPIELPYISPLNKEEYRANVIYKENHYFDNINLEDPRLWNTDFLYGYIDNYFQEWVDPLPDSLAMAAKNLVEKTKNNEFCFKEMLSYLVNQSVSSSVMGSENTWSKLAEDYIFDKDIPWISKAQLQNLKNKYEVIKHNRIGMKAHNLQLETIDGKTVNTNEINAEYTLLYFYDPHCGNCVEEIPRLHNNIYAKYKDKGVEIVAINIRDNKDDWIKYITNQKLNDWINCADMKYTSQYWLYYDTTGVPTSYILDKDKIIIGKQLSTQNIEKLLDFYLSENNGIN